MKTFRSGIECIPQDILFNILVYLPISDIFNFRLISRSNYEKSLCKEFLDQVELNPKDNLSSTDLKKFEQCINRSFKYLHLNLLQATVPLSKTYLKNITRVTITVDKLPIISKNCSHFQDLHLYDVVQPPTNFSVNQSHPKFLSYISQDESKAEEYLTILEELKELKKLKFTGCNDFYDYNILDVVLKNTPKTVNILILESFTIGERKKFEHRLRKQLAEVENFDHIIHWSFINVSLLTHFPISLPHSVKTFNCDDSNMMAPININHKTIEKIRLDGLNNRHMLWDCFNTEIVKTFATFELRNDMFYNHNLCDCSNLKSLTLINFWICEKCLMQSTGLHDNLECLTINQCLEIDD